MDGSGPHVGASPQLVQLTEPGGDAFVPGLVPVAVIRLLAAHVEEARAGDHRYTEPSANGREHPVWPLLIEIAQARLQRAQEVEPFRGQHVRIGNGEQHQVGARSGAHPARDVSMVSDRTHAAGTKWPPRLSAVRL